MNIELKNTTKQENDSVLAFLDGKDISYSIREEKGFSVVSYQCCPKCHGQGVVSKPPYLPAEVAQWSGTAVVFTCDVCLGAKIIPMHIIINEQDTNQIKQP